MDWTLSQSALAELKDLVANHFVLVLVVVVLAREFCVDDVICFELVD